MLSKADEAAREYAIAYLLPPDAGSGHPPVLDRLGTPCTPRMARLRNAGFAVVDLAGHQEELPAPVKQYIDAEGDRGCGRCWVSSNPRKEHPECKEKIRRWFAAREVLVEYGKSLL